MSNKLATKLAALLEKCTRIYQSDTKARRNARADMTYREQAQVRNCTGCYISESDGVYRVRNGNCSASECKVEGSLWS